MTYKYEGNSGREEEKYKKLKGPVDFNLGREVQLM